MKRIGAEPTRSLSVLAAVILFLAAIQFKDFSSFLNTDNVFSTHDAFRYARFAKEIQEGVHGAIDYLVDVPDFRANPSVPYLLSLLAAVSSGLSGVRVEFFFACIPPFLSVLYVIPMYMWLLTFTGSRYVFLGASLLGTCNFIYAIRTPPGYFDTDCLILTFVFAILLCITRAVTEKERPVRSYAYVAASGLLIKVFTLWYDVYIFGSFGLFSLCAGLILFRHGLRDAALKVTLFVIAADPFSLWKGLILNEYLSGVFLKERVNLLPVSVFSTITEFRGVSLAEFASFTTGTAVTAALALGGIAILYIRHYRHMTIALPILALGLTTFLSGNRYILYLGPFLGMGLGYLVHLSVDHLQKTRPAGKRATALAGIVLTVLLCFPFQRLSYSPIPFMSQDLYDDFRRLGAITEENSFIWTWWDYGFAIEHLARRGTFIDGGNYHPVKMDFIARSFMTEDERVMKRSISFLTETLSRDYLKEGVTIDQIRNQAAAHSGDPSRPVYVVIDRNMLQKDFLYRLGSGRIDLAASRMPLIKGPYPCGRKAESSPDARGLPPDRERYLDCGPFLVDPAAFSIVSPQGAFRVAEIFREVRFIRGGAGGQTVKVVVNKDALSGNVLQIVITEKEKVYFSIADELAKDSLLNRMYVLRESFGNFDLVMDDFPHLVVYRVAPRSPGPGGR